MKYMVDPVKFAVNGAVSAFMLLLTFGAAVYAHWVIFAVCLVTFLGFLLFTLDYGSTVEVCGSEITRRLPALDKKGKTYSRSEVMETGVMGTNIFNRRSKTKTGTMYLYFSPRKLSELDRFDMGLKWPRDVIRMRFSKERYFSAQLFWDGELAKYNIGDLEL